MLKSVVNNTNTPALASIMIFIACGQDLTPASHSSRRTISLKAVPRTLGNLGYM